MEVERVVRPLVLAALAALKRLGVGRLLRIAWFVHLLSVQHSQLQLAVNLHVSRVTQMTAGIVVAAASFRDCCCCFDFDTLRSRTGLTVACATQMTQMK